MEKKRLSNYKKTGIIMQVLFLFILLPGLYVLWHAYSQSMQLSWIGIVLVLVYLAVNVIYTNCYYLSRIRCPICKSICFAQYEEMQSDRKTWVHIQFPYKKCGILWDPEEKININKKQFDKEE